MGKFIELCLLRFIVLYNFELINPKYRCNGNWITDAVL